MLSSYYLIFTVIDCFLMIVGNSLFSEDADFACYDGHTIIPLNNAGATYLMLYTFLILCYSLVIWIVFYRIPVRFSLLFKTKDPLILDSRDGHEHIQQAMVDSLMKISSEDGLFL